jgi:hypothetical protein
MLVKAGVFDKAGGENATKLRGVAVHGGVGVEAEDL